MNPCKTFKPFCPSLILYAWTKAFASTLNQLGFFLISSLTLLSSVANAAPPLACPVNQFSNPDNGVSRCTPCPTGTSTNRNVNQPYCGFPADGYVVFANFDWPAKVGAPPWQASAWGPATLTCPQAAARLNSLGWGGASQGRPLLASSIAAAYRPANNSSQYAYGANCLVQIIDSTKKDMKGAWTEMPKFYFDPNYPTEPTRWVGK